MKAKTWFNRKPAVRNDYQELLNVGRWEYDVTKGEVHCSLEVYQIYGLPDRGSSESPDVFVEMIHPDDKEIVKQFWNQISSGKRLGRSFTYRTLQRGRQAYVQYTAQCKYDDRGDLIRIEGTVRDVTRYMENDTNTALLHPTESFYANHPGPIVVIDQDLGIVRVNRATEELFGWTEQELLFRRPPFVPIQHQETILELYRTLLKHGGTIWIDCVRLTRDGTAIDVGACLSAIRDTSGKIVGALASYTRMGVANNAPEMLLDSEGQFQALVRHSSDVFVILANDLRIKYISPAIANVLGYAINDVVNTDFLDLIHPSDRRTCEANIADITAGLQKKSSAELRFRNKAGVWRFCQTTFHDLYKGSGMDGCIVNFHDVTERRQTKELMNYIADHDYLTDLPNRRAFVERLSTMIGLAAMHHSELGVLTMSLNKFKYVNDTLGHSVGDKLIRHISQQIRDSIRGECVAARIGGDEFAILIPDLPDRDSVFALATDLLSRLQDAIQVDQYAVYVTAGIGVSFYPADGSDAETLVKHADIALHRAKERGNNTWQAYSATLTAGTYKEFSLANDFRKALQNDEFLLYYQPRLDTKTRKIVAAEALIRWEHEDWGLVSPLEFIHIAEETGLIVPLGNWILTTVCRQLHAWSESGLADIRVSVNISAKQFLVDDFVDSVRSILREFDVKPQRVEFEITETTIIPNDSAIVESIKRLREMGIAIYFDDFGTGYSSLSWLQRFELDGIKLDKSFVTHVPVRWAPTQIVSSVIQLAHSLNLTVVAEGVEANEQLAFLQDEKCEQVQGFLFSRPLPVDQFEELLGVGVIDPIPSNPPSRVQLPNRRKHFRVATPHPLIGQVTIAAINSKKLALGYTEALIMDIGPGGLRFVSNLRFPANHGVVLHFMINILGSATELDGTIVWSEEIGDDLSQYGVQFALGHTAKDALIPLLNEFAVKLRSGQVAGCDFVTGDIATFFRNESSV